MAGRRRTPADELDVDHLRRLQRGARAALALGIGASLAANVLAADPSLVGKLIAAWSPIALLVTVELLFRIPTTSGTRSYLRIGAAVPIAVIAAWVSYHHMVEVAEAYGETRSAALLLPFSVDGLVIVASVSLAEIAHRLQAAESSTTRPSANRSTTARPPTQQRTTATTKPSSSKPAAASTASASASVERRSTTDVGDQVRRLVAEHPDWTRTRVAEEIGCSVRTVRRHLATEPNRIRRLARRAAQSAGADPDRPATAPCHQWSS